MAETAKPEMSAISYCADQVQKHDPDRFMTVMLAPPNLRGDLVSLYAFNLEVAKTRETVSEGLLGDIRLQWWRDAIDECYGPGQPRRHAVVEALAETIQRHDLPRDPFDRLLTARAADLDDEPPATLNAFNAYLDGTAVTLAELALRVLQVDDEARQVAGRKAALAFATIGQVRALPSMLQQRRHHLPASLIRAHGVDTGALAEMQHHAALGALIEELCDQASHHILAARTVRPTTAYPVIAQARIADCYRRRLIRTGYNPFLQSVEKKPVLLPLLLMLDRVF